YFHAPAGARHLDVVNAWIERAKQARALGQFRWYRMEDLARFMNQRELARWSYRDGTLSAGHPQSLVGLAWLLRGVKAERLQVVQGQARIEASGDDVIVRALDGQSFVVAPVASTGGRAP
ncbi:MAG TPA: hypothetical protein VIY30_14260, partial [Burkholderiaceae bacterium]